MKKSGFLFSLLTGLIIAPICTLAATNDCIKHINDHVTTHPVMGLNLQSCSLTDKEVPAITDFLQKKPQFIALNVNDNIISARGIAQIAAIQTLRYLYLEFNYVNDDGAIALAKTGSSLRVVMLKNNLIRDKGAIALANLQAYWLVLDNNVIGDEGAAALAKNTYFNTLSLQRNLIGLAGAKAFAFANNSSLKSLDLSSNYITNEGAAAFRHNNTLTSLFLMQRTFPTMERLVSPIIQHCPI